MTEKRFTLVDDEFVSRIKNNGVSMTAREIVDCLNALHEENTHIKNTIQTMIKNERTAIGQSVLQQLWEQIQC